MLVGDVEKSSREQLARADVLRNVAQDVGEASYLSADERCQGIRSALRSRRGLYSVGDQRFQGSIESANRELMRKRCGIDLEAATGLGRRRNEMLVDFLYASMKIVVLR